MSTIMSLTTPQIRETYPSSPKRLAILPPLIASSTSLAVLHSWKSSEYFSIKLIDTSICSNASIYQLHLRGGEEGLTSNTVCCVDEVWALNFGRAFSEASHQHLQIPSLRLLTVPRQRSVGRFRLEEREWWRRTWTKTFLPVVPL